jgi:anti-sigma factor (TIGR02949 family)
MKKRRTRIDCREAFERLYAYLDGELTTEKADEVREHLDACKDCFHLATFESAYLRFLEARTRAQHAPEVLKKRILRHLLFSENASEHK